MNLGLFLGCFFMLIGTGLAISSFFVGYENIPLILGFGTGTVIFGTILMFIFVEDNRK